MVFWVDYVPRQLHLDNNILYNSPSPKKMEPPSCGARGKGSTLTLVTLSLWRKRPKSWVRIRAMHLRDEPLVGSCLTHKDYFAVINLSKKVRCDATRDFFLLYPSHPELNNFGT
jgi:hypothetical protein